MRNHHDLVSESAGLEQKGKLRHQLGAANACGGPSCCWCPGPPGPPGVGLPLSQRGLEVQMPAALAMRAGGVLKLERATACLHPQPGSGPAGDPLFRASWPSTAFPTVPLKTLLVPGQPLGFGSEETSVFQRRSWYWPSTLHLLMWMKD